MIGSFAFVQKDAEKQEQPRLASGASAGTTRRSLQGTSKYVNVTAGSSVLTFYLTRKDFLTQGASSILFFFLCSVLRFFFFFQQKSCTFRLHAVSKYSQPLFSVARAMASAGDPDAAAITSAGHAAEPPSLIRLK